MSYTRTYAGLTGDWKCRTCARVWVYSETGVETKYVTEWRWQFYTVNWQEFSWHKFAYVIYLDNLSCITYASVQLLLQESLPSAVCLIAAIPTHLVIGISQSFTFGCICLLCWWTTTLLYNSRGYQYLSIMHITILQPPHTLGALYNLWTFIFMLFGY